MNEDDAALLVEKMGKSIEQLERLYDDVYGSLNAEDLEAVENGLQTLRRVGWDISHDHQAAERAIAALRKFPARIGGAA